MTWTPDGPQGNEAEKVKHLIVPYTRGRGLDIGCGPSKAWPHFISVDNLHHDRMFGWNSGDVDFEMDASDLSIFATGSLDFVFSSHTLEHIEDFEAALREWWRVLRVGGHLVLYLPHKDLYPNIGQPGANPDHKHDFLPDDILDAMRRIGAGWDCLEDEERAEGHEYSFLQVYRKTDGVEQRYTPWRRGVNECLVIRYGAYGDQIQASSILPALKEQGWNITYNTVPRGHEVLKSNPYIDRFLIQDKDQVPAEMLYVYVRKLEERFDLVINLTESVETSLLPAPGNVKHGWPHAIRHRMLNRNYLEHIHDIAGVPHEFHARFHPSPAEREKAGQILDSREHPTIVWALAGSSVHKAWPWIDQALVWIAEHTPFNVAFVGGPECAMFEDAIFAALLRHEGDTIPDDMSTEELRALLTDRHGDRFQGLSGRLTMAEAMALAIRAEMVVGPETGVLNAAGLEDNIKIVMLSHSSHENLTKHWKNTVALGASVPCFPCHQIHFSRQFCPSDEATGASICAAGIKPETVFETICRKLGHDLAREAAE